jgi:O-antigen/teichoic acid export membrane protein
MSVRRSAASFGLATALGHASQLLWLAAGIRVMTASEFGSVLAAQALYGVLQIVVDVGTNALGARMAARGELDDERRGEILRMRLILALAVAPVALVLGGLNVSGSLVATLPFVVALCLFAVLNVWEPYGSGDARPWATYMFARSGVLAAVAGAFLVTGGHIPVVLAGVLECLAIVGVMVIFGPTPIATLRAAVRARPGPWRSVFSASWPALATQSSLAAGTLALSGSGSPATAGVFAACVRLLSGITAINGIVATSLYPRLAQRAREGSDADRRVVTVALRLISVLAAGATAVCVLFGGAITGTFLGRSSPVEVAALVLAMAAALPLGNIVMFAYQMLARGHERAMVPPFALGSSLTVGLAVATVATAGARVDLVAASLLIGQLVNMAWLGQRVRDRCPYVARVAARAMATAALVDLVACASLLPGAALPAGLALVALAVALVAGLRAFAGSLLAELGRRRRPGSTPV